MWLPRPHPHAEEVQAGREGDASSALRRGRVAWRGGSVLPADGAVRAWVRRLEDVAMPWMTNGC